MDSHLVAKKSWKTSLGGALGGLGKTLLGVGIVPQLNGVQSHMLTNIAIAGFILDALGGFFAHLFAADNSAVKSMIEVAKEGNERLGPDGKN